MNGVVRAWAMEKVWKIESMEYKYEGSPEESD